MYLSRLNKDAMDLVLGFVEAQDLGNLSCTCLFMKSLLYESSEDIWRHVYSRHRFGLVPKFPFVEGCGSWRDIVTRVKERTIRVNIQLLGCMELVLVIPRSTALFGLKKIIREHQLSTTRVGLDDFELVYTKSDIEMGVQGYDSLPPSDLSILFVSTDTMIRSARANRTVQSILINHQRAAWRKNLLYEADGVELKQILTGANAAINYEGLETAAFRVIESHGTETASWDLLTEMFDNSTSVNSHKFYWNEPLHPFVHIALAPGMPFKMRMYAMVKLIGIYISYITSADFFVSSVAKAFIEGGFLATFSRLSLSIVPLIFGTQVKQLMEGEIDWIPLMFAFRFSLRALIVALQASLPILKLATSHQALLVMIRTIFHAESSSHDLLVHGLLLLMGMYRSKPKKKTLLPRFINILSRGDTQYINMLGGYVHQFLIRHVPTVYGVYCLVLQGKPHSQFVMSCIAWRFIQRRMSHPLLVSLPIYAYSIPFLTSLLLVRLRMALSNSYYYLFYV